MRCINCGHEFDDNSRFCPNCGSGVGQYGTNPGYQQPVEESASVGLAILSFFIPLAGLIIFLVNKEKRPKTAKASGICALVSFVLNMVITGVVLFWSYSLTSDILDVVGNEGFYESVEDGYVDSDNYIDLENDSDEDLDEDANANDTVANSESSNNESTNSESNTGNSGNNAASLSTDWKKYEFIINGKTLTLPCSYQDIVDVTGYKMKSSEEKSYLEGGYYSSVNLYDSNNNFVLSVDVLNDSDEDKCYVDCPVVRVYQDEYNLEKGSHVVTFAGGLQVGQKITKDELVAMFGQYQDEYVYDGDSDYQSEEYTWAEDDTWTTYNYIKVSILNGAIDEIIIDHKDH